MRSISEDDVVRYTPEKTAYRIDWPAFYEGFNAALPNESHFAEPNPEEAITVQLPLIRQKPPATVKSLQDEGLSEKSLNSPPVSEPAGPDASIT